MQGKGYWNIITHNAKLVTSSSEFRRSYAGDLLRDIGLIFIFICDVSLNTKSRSYVGCTFTPRIKKTSPLIPKDVIFGNIWKSCLTLFRNQTIIIKIIIIIIIILLKQDYKIQLANNKIQMV